jgi:hypothetical protein
MKFEPCNLREKRTMNSSTATILTAISQLENRTSREAIDFEIPDDVKAAAGRACRSVELVLDVISDSLPAVQAALERFGRGPIEDVLGSGARRVLQAFDTFAGLVGIEDTLATPSDG